MPAPRYISGPALREAVSMEAAIAALDELFSRPLPTTPQRSVIERDDNQFLLMPSWDSDAAGVKLITVNPSNPNHGVPLINGLYVLFSGDTLQPVALIDAAALTALRTAAVSGLATKYLARRDCRHAVIFGAGVQGAAHVEALRAIRPVEAVTVVSRTQSRAEDLARSLKNEGLNATVGAPHAVATADVICTCTTSNSPLFPGSTLAPGCHVNAVGAHRPDARELDTAAIQRGTVIVETRASAVAEAGDLMIPMEEGAITVEHIKGELAEVVAGSVGRTIADEITIFKSVGVAFEDLAVARACLRLVGG